MSRPRVAVFARAPVEGRVKTRLAAAVGDARACALYRWLGARVVGGLVRDAARPYDVTVHFTPAGEGDAVRAWLAGADDYVAQREGDLGARLADAVAGHLGAGASSVLLVGTDCAAVDDARVREALAALRDVDAVLGPARDGGYYLLGVRRAMALFDDVPWSTAAVADATRARLRAAGATWRELAVEDDVDTVDDLVALRGLADVPPWIAG